MSKIWVLAGDSTRARVFFTDKRNGELTEEFDLVNPEARLHERDLTTDLPGSTTNSATGMRHSYGSDESHKPRAAELFAKDVAKRLESGRTKGQWNKLPASWAGSERRWTGIPHNSLPVKLPRT